MAFVFDVTKCAIGVCLQVTYRDKTTTEIILRTPQVAALLAISENLETTVKEALLIKSPVCDGAVYAKTQIGSGICATVSYW